MDFDQNRSKLSENRNIVRAIFGSSPRTSTIDLTNATLKYGFQIADKGLENACRDNEVIYSTVNTYEGKLTCRNVADSFAKKYTDIRIFLRVVINVED